MYPTVDDERPTAAEAAYESALDAYRSVSTMVTELALMAIPDKVHRYFPQVTRIECLGEYADDYTGIRMRVEDVYEGDTVVDDATDGYEEMLDDVNPLLDYIALLNGEDYVSADPITFRFHVGGTSVEWKVRMA